MIYLFRLRPYLLTLASLGALWPLCERSENHGSQRRLTRRYKNPVLQKKYSQHSFYLNHSSPPSLTKTTMKLSSTVAFFIATVPLAQAVTVAWDSVYGKASNSIDLVACSDGENGMEVKGYKTLGALPQFPNIGAAAAVEGWNSLNCGTCWQITYTSSAGVKRSLNMTAIDSTDAGFVLSEAAMNTLTGGLAKQLGRVNATAKQVSTKSCGF
jgi:hypothetical protein